MLSEGMIQAGGEANALGQQAKAQEMVRFKQEMDALKNRLTSGQTKEEELRQACQDFEAVFMGKLWQEMQATVPKEGYLHGKSDQMYLSMFEQPFSEHLAKSGGIGLADMLYDQLASKLKSTSSATLPGNVEIKPLAENGKADIKPLAQSLPRVDTAIADDRDTKPLQAAANTAAPLSAPKPDPADGKRVDELSQVEVDARLAALAESLAKGVAEELAEPAVAAADLSPQGDALVADASVVQGHDPARTWDQAVVHVDRPAPPVFEAVAVSGPEPESSSESMPEAAAKTASGPAAGEGEWVSADALLSKP